MIQIAICDDDDNVAKYLQDYLEETRANISDVWFDISRYHSAVDFLKAFENGLRFDVVFMDIEMEGINGVTAGQVLRDMSDGDDAVMIYISSHSHFSASLVQIGSFRFIKKPIDKVLLEDAFSRALKQATKLKKATRASPFRFKSGADTVSVNISDIVYFKNVKRTIDIYIWDNARNCITLLTKFYSTVDEALEQLPETTFVRCERSHIVNLKYVLRLTKDALDLAGNITQIPVSKGFKSNVKKAYFEYWG